jgi:hypothetical protein
MSILQGFVHRPLLRQVITKPQWTQEDGQRPYSKTWYIIVGVDKGPVGPVGQEVFSTYLSL